MVVKILWISLALQKVGRGLVHLYDEVQGYGKGKARTNMANYEMFFYEIFIIYGRWYQNLY